MKLQVPAPAGGAKTATARTGGRQSQRQSWRGGTANLISFSPNHTIPRVESAETDHGPCPYPAGVLEPYQKMMNEKQATPEGRAPQNTS